MQYRVFVFLWLVTCASAAAQPAALRSLDAGSQTGITSPRQTAIRTDTEWQALWREHAANRPAPSVDFTREIVVAVFVGSRPTAGYSVAIVGAAEEGGALRVRYREIPPRPDAMTAQVITFPYAIAAVTRPRTGDVVFEAAPLVGGRPQAANTVRRVPNGVWSGEHVQLTVSDAGADVEFDCARGRITQPLAVTTSGDFDVPGTFAPERGGPLRQDGGSTPQNARYAGRLRNDTLELKVMIPGSTESIGTFTLTRGGTALLKKCR
jgi:hypothetical protein